MPITEWACALIISLSPGVVFKALSSPNLIPIPTPTSKPQGCPSLRNYPEIALTNTPHPSRDAQMLIEDVKRIVHELDQGQQLSSIGVELVDNELAILYMNSKKSEVILDFYP